MCVSRFNVEAESIQDYKKLVRRTECLSFLIVVKTVEEGGAFMDQAIQLVRRGLVTSADMMTVVR